MELRGHRQCRRSARNGTLTLASFASFCSNPPYLATFRRTDGACSGREGKAERGIRRTRSGHATPVAQERDPTSVQNRPRTRILKVLAELSLTNRGITFRSGEPRATRWSNRRNRERERGRLGGGRTRARSRSRAIRGQDTGGGRCACWLE